ncbi:alpha/beta hydrolase [Kovacikia minuta CCNUW1]|uniref:alpha/beta hydrolase n=1 Tax=Kovacikia minuta TaxID=2931930 RepID=UPI001CCFBC6E|nr:alpha/beta hydrolase [Kovacikia minuta]UBF24671.1 alpha/beta hydrolase [Kovacikia minuta CCNUW1]
MLVYLSLCLGFFFFQQRLIFFPSSTLKHTPALYQLRYQDLWIPVATKDGRVERINAWWIPADNPADNPQTPVMVYFHHNALNIGANVSQAEKFRRMGCSILLFDYRGFGRSEGSFPTETQVYEDAEVVWKYLTQERKIPAHQIFIYGHSVGGAIAINLAVKHPEAAGLITQNSFTSLRDMTKRFGLFWLFPVDLLLTQRFESLKKISLLRIPVLFIHGMEDPQIPVDMGKALFAAASEPKQLLLIPKAGHDNNMEPPYYEVVKKFMQRHSCCNGFRSGSPVYSTFGESG